MPQYKITVSGNGTAQEISDSLIELASVLSKKGQDADFEDLGFNNKHIDAEIEREKLFLAVFKDGSGRPSTQVGLDQLLERDDRDDEGNLDWDGEVLISEWAEEAEIGEEWENSAEKYIRVE